MILADRYLLEAVLGEGATGVVHRALDVHSDERVAVKVLHERLLGDAAVVERFRREAHAASRLDHPNCVRVLDAGTTDAGTMYMVMPLLDGVELRATMTGPMPVARAVSLALQVLEGLSHAHERGFVHRDVKPENVLLVRDHAGAEVAKLVDFGLVKASVLDRARPLTEAGRVFGTPWYMSPEQCSGKPVDARADLYATGAMLFEMLAGRPPFEGDSLAVVLRRHMLADPPDLPPWVPSSLAAFVHRLLAKDPDDRPGSAAHAAAELRRALEPGQSITLGPTMLPTLASLLEADDPGPPPSMLTSLRAQGRMFAAVCAAVCALVVLVAAPQLFAAETEAAEAETEVEVEAVADVELPVVDEPVAPTIERAPEDAVPVVPPAIAIAEPDPIAVEPAPPRASAPVATTKPGKPQSKKPSKPAPSRPRATESRRQPEPEPERHLRPTRPPRGESKLPPSDRTARDSRDADGRLHLRPRAQ